MFERIARIVSGLIFRISTETVHTMLLFHSGHSGLFRYLVVFILRFVKTGTPTPLSEFPNIRSDPAP